MGILDSSLGIDFRQNHLILTFLKKSFRKIRLVDYVIHPILPEEQREEREGQWINQINSFLVKHHLSRERVFLSIPREKVAARFIRLPLTVKENLRKVLEYEIPKYIPFESGDVYFDYHILKEGKEGLDLFTVFVKRSEMDGYLSLLKKIGIQPVSVQIPSTAALNLFLFHEGERDGQISVLLDVTDPFFEMNLIEGKEWKESLHIPLSQQPRAAQIINTFKRLGPAPPLFSKSTFFVYGLATDETLVSTLRESGQIAGVAPPPLHRVDSGEERAKLLPIYGSIGVPLGGLTHPKVNLNLLPLEMRKKVREVGKPLSVILLCLVLLLAVAWGGGAFARYRNDLNRVNQEIKKRKPEVEVVEKLQKRKETLRKEISEFGKIHSGEISKIDILKEITQLLPATVWLWSLKYNGREIEINGYADSASDLITLLDKSPLFEKVEFLAPVTKERLMKPEGEKERFRIRAKIEERRPVS
jgi:general secretion pathway protein L